MVNARDYTAPFHISILVHSISEAIDFYRRDLGFPILREYDKARHFDCFGNQMVVHERVGYDATLFQTSVENDDFVVPHFGIILSELDYDQFAKRLVEQNFDFFGRPRARFIGKTYEQKVMFLKDPSGNAFEFKCYKHLSPEEWA